LELTSPTSGGRSVGIVRSRTKATGFSFRKSEIRKEAINRYVERHHLTGEREDEDIEVVERERN
jgi:hypothetical protein